MMVKRTLMKSFAPFRNSEGKLPNEEKSALEIWKKRWTM